MLTHLSTVKRARQNTKRRSRNRKIKSMVKTNEKRVRQSQQKDQALVFLKEADASLDKAASKGVLHARTAARHKSRLAKKVNKMAESPVQTTKDKK